MCSLGHYYCLHFYLKNDIINRFLDINMDLSKKHTSMAFDSDGRLIYFSSKGKNISGLSGSGDVADWIFGENADAVSSSSDDLLKLKRELPKSSRESNDNSDNEVNPFAKKIDSLPRPVTKKAKETLRQRTKNEIFGDLETQEWYINQIKEALERLDGDRLHEFILSHQSYSRSAFVSWNNELFDLLGVSIPDEYAASKKSMTNRRVTAALQHALIDAHKNDVFQITKKEHGQWINVDGKCGPYVVANLAEYWKAVFKPSSQRENPSYPELDPEYNYESKESLREDYGYLESQISDSELSPYNSSNTDQSVDTASVLADEL